MWGDSHNISSAGHRPVDVIVGTTISYTEVDIRHHLCAIHSRNYELLDFGGDMEETVALPRRRPRKSTFWESPVFIYGLKIFLGFVVVMVFLTITQCTIKKPESPTWTTNVTLPLVNRTYQMPEIIRKIDQPGITIDSTGSVVYSVEIPLDTILLDAIVISPSDPAPVVVRLSDYVSLQLGAVPPTSFDINLDFPPVDRFSWATISSGGFDVVFVNDFGVPLDTIIGDIVDVVNSRVISSVSIPGGLAAGASDTVFVNLAGQTVSNTISINLHCFTPGGTMLSLDDKSLSAALRYGSGITVSAASGIIDPTDAVFNNIYADIDLPKGFDSIQLVNAVLTLEIVNAVNFPGFLNIDITGSNSQVLNLTGNVLPGSATTPVSTNLINNDLASFLNPMPSAVTVNGAATLGDGVTAGIVTSNDYIVSRIRLESPLEAVIGQSTFRGDIDSEEIEQDDIDLATEHILRAQFLTSIVNHLPLGVNIEILFSGDSNTVYANPQLVLGPFQVAPGEIGPDNTVLNEVISENAVTLDSLDVQILKNPVLYSGQIITLLGSGGIPVKIVGSDYVTARGVIQVEYRFDGDF